MRGWLQNGTDVNLVNSNTGNNNPIRFTQNDTCAIVETLTNFTNTTNTDSFDFQAGATDGRGKKLNNAAVQVKPTIEYNENTVTVTMGGFDNRGNNGVMAEYTAPIPSDGEIVSEWDYTITLRYNGQEDVQTGTAYVENGSLRYVNTQSDQTGGTVKAIRIDESEAEVSHGNLSTYCYNNYDRLLK